MFLDVRCCCHKCMRKFFNFFLNAFASGLIGLAFRLKGMIIGYLGIL